MSQSTEGAILRNTGEMKRLIPIFAAVIALAGPLATGGAAVAKDQHGGDRGARSSDRGGDRGGRRGGERGGGAGSGRPGRRYRWRRGLRAAAASDRGRGYERPVYPAAAARRQAIAEPRRPYRGDRRAYEYDAPPPPYAPQRAPRRLYAAAGRRPRSRTTAAIGCGRRPGASPGSGPPTATPWSGAGPAGSSTSCPTSRASPSASG